MKQIKLGELVLDYSIYPRKEVDRQHVSIIQEAIQGGAEMPPLVICAKSKRIVDGAHRYKAYQRISDGNPDFLVTCVEKHYKSDGELFLDAMRYNASHGRSLTKFDRTHCILLAKTLRVADKDVSKALHVPVAAIKQLVVDRSATRVNGQQKLEPIKATIKHKAGQKLSEEQFECNAKLGGMQQTFYVNQIIMLIENNLLNTEDAKLMDRIERLSQLLEGVIART